MKDTPSQTPGAIAQRKLRNRRKGTPEAEADKKVAIERMKQWRLSNVGRSRATRNKWMRTTVQGYFNKKMTTIRANARSRGLVVDIGVKFLVDMLAAQDGNCAVLNIPMVINSMTNNPMSLSVDRIDDTQGYILGNIRLVCWWYNCARMKGMTDEDVMEMATTLIGTRDGR